MPHAAVRAYVMGERAHDEATRDDIAEMAGSPSRRSPPAPSGSRRRARSCTARSTASSRARTLRPTSCWPSPTRVGRAGHGVFQLVSDQQGGGDERDWLPELARRTGATVTYALAQTPYAPTAYRDALDDAERFATAGIHIVPQVACRPTGMLFGLQSSLHPFITHPT